METMIVPVEKPEEMNIILGQSHFIKTVEDLHEAMATAAPGIRFGLAFCEASGPCLVRTSGNDEALIALAEKNALALATGHAFIIFMENCFPIHVLTAVKRVQEVCRIFCATANQVEVIVAETGLGRGIMGVIDGCSAKAVESDEDVKVRKQFLQDIGYKL
jgi:adenosine/AMP kinase